MQPIVPRDDGATNFMEGAASLACDEHEIVGFGSADSGRDGGVTVGFFEGTTTQTCLEISQDGGHRHMTWSVAGEDHFVSRCGRRPQGLSLFRG
jgi:hypothetical protein